MRRTVLSILALSIFLSFGPCVAPAASAETTAAAQFKAYLQAKNVPAAEQTKRLEAFKKLPPGVQELAGTSSARRIKPLAKQGQTQIQAARPKTGVTPPKIKVELPSLAITEVIPTSAGAGDYVAVWGFAFASGSVVQIDGAPQPTFEVAGDPTSLESRVDLRGPEFPHSRQEMLADRQERRQNLRSEGVHRRFAARLSRDLRLVLRQQGHPDHSLDHFPQLLRARRCGVLRRQPPARGPAMVRCPLLEDRQRGQLLRHGAAEPASGPAADGGAAPRRLVAGEFSGANMGLHQQSSRRPGLAEHPGNAGLPVGRAAAHGDLELDQPRRQTDLDRRGPMRSLEQRGRDGHRELYRRPRHRRL